MICERTKELRVFYVQRRDARSLGDHIRQNVAPGTTVYPDEWRGCVCVDSLRDGNGPMGLDHLTVEPLAAIHRTRNESQHAPHRAVMGKFDGVPGPKGEGLQVDERQLAK
ncbi:hypothetical protein IscW_ISCW001162 [Ixodes scapularis]|uniref:Uncharacterized protein n=1 Tax=Ixodes scapularis TaxID=6945 RepID=B7P1B8_IXOSC|nr:hypothetical protein IscW_ISCW001162 [Ixodes scapularis]|eukprot:XP_002433326.1 hypothetical protein IscW_ISCW001162 [Ixodes scapularis]